MMVKWLLISQDSNDLHQRTWPYAILISIIQTKNAFKNAMKKPQITEPGKTPPLGIFLWTLIHSRH